jgi:hypothetical protein
MFHNRLNLNSLRLGIAAMAMAVIAVQSAQAATPDRIYLLGNGEGENGAAGAPVGGANTINPGATLDQQGSESNLPTFSDMTPVGGPVYVSTVGRPGAAAGDVGVTLDGTNDRLFITNGLGYPQNGDDVFGSPPNPSYETLTSRIAQGWVRPTGAALNSRQDVFNDTYQFGIHITPDSKWSMNFGSDSGVINSYNFDSTVAVQYNQWTHVMQRTFNATNGALFINGVAVRVSPTSNPNYYSIAGAAVGTANDDMVLGSNLAGDGNFFQGDMDDWVFSVAGNNSTSPNGANYGGINVGLDNQYIVAQNFVAGDLNGDGQVNGDGTGAAASDDVSFFVAHFLQRRTVDGAQIGDIISRTQMGDLNFDGITNLADWYIVTQNYAGAASLDIGGLLSAGNVPEPTTAGLTILGLLSMIGVCGRRRKFCA